MQLSKQNTTKQTKYNQANKIQLSKKQHQQIKSVRRFFKNCYSSPEADLGLLQHPRWSVL